MPSDSSDPLLDQAAAAFGGWSLGKDDIDATIGKAAAQYGLPPSVIAGVVQQESNGQPGVTSSTGDQGITQFQPTTAQSTGSDGKPYVENVWNPHDSIMGTAKLLHDTMTQSKVDLPTALMMYNAGTDKSKWNPAYAQGVMEKGKAYIADRPGAAADPLLEQAAGVFGPQAKAMPQGEAQATPQAQGDGGFGVTAKVPAGVTIQPVGGAPEVTPAPAPVAAIPANVAAPAASPTPAPAPAATPTPAPADGSNPIALPWGHTENILNALTLGTSSRTAAATAAMLHPGPFMQNYNQARTGQIAGETQFANANPLENMATRIVGPIPATMAGTGMLGLGARFGANLISDAAPAVEPAISALTDFLSGVGGGSSTVGKLASNVASNALQGGTAAGLTSGLSTEPLSHQLATGALTGGIIGPLFSSGAKELLPEIAPADAALAREAEKRGIVMPLSTLTKGTEMGNIADAPTADDVQQLTARASQLLGQNKNTVHLSDIADAKSYNARRINLAEPLIKIDADPARNPGFMLGTGEADTAAGVLPNGSQLGLAGINSKLMREIEPESPNRVPIQNALDQVRAKIDPKTGILEGKNYGILVKTGGPVSDLLKSQDPIQRQYGGYLKNLLDTSAEAASPPGVMSELYDARQKYAIANDLQNAAANAGNSGILHPGNIFQSLKDSPGQESRLLAQVANYYPKVLNASGAPNVRVGVGNILSNIIKKHGTSAVLGGMTGAYASGVPGEGALVAGLAAPLASELKDRIVSGMANSSNWRNMLLDMADPSKSTPIKAQVLQRVNQVLPDALTNLQNSSWTPQTQGASK